MRRDLIRQISVVIAMTGTLVINALANILPLNGQNTGEISDRFKVLFVPAGYVFSIWGLILVLYAIYQALPSQRNNPRLQRTGYWFVFSCLANIVWLFLWHYNQFSLTLVAMLSLLVSLIVIYLRLGVGQVDVSPGEKWLVHLTFSVYLGWVSVATIANVTDVLDFLGWSGWGLKPQLWAVIMLVLACGLAITLGMRRRDIAYMLVIVWAFIGIALKQSNVVLVSYSTWILTAVVLGFAIWIAIQQSQLTNK